MTDKTDKTDFNGGPAFPVSTVSATAGHQDGHMTWQFPGMTLRDYFAARCPPDVLEIEHWSSAECAATIGLEASEYEWRKHFIHVKARLAMEWADAMLKARKS